jgi:hypothetical protein
MTQAIMADNMDIKGKAGNLPDLISLITAIPASKSIGK